MEPYAGAFGETGRATQRTVGPQSHPSTAVGVGPAAQSSSWMQHLADALAQPLSYVQPLDKRNNQLESADVDRPRNSTPVPISNARTGPCSEFRRSPIQRRTRCLQRRLGPTLRQRTTRLVGQEEHVHHPDPSVETLAPSTLNPACASAEVTQYRSPAWSWARTSKTVIRLDASAMRAAVGSGCGDHRRSRKARSRSFSRRARSSSRRWIGAGQLPADRGRRFPERRLHRPPDDCSTSPRANSWPQ